MPPAVAVAPVMVAVSYRTAPIATWPLLATLVSAAAPFVFLTWVVPGGNDAASVTSNSTVPADMSLSKVASQEPAVQGTTFAYTIAVGNYGPASGTGVIVADSLPAGVTFVSATPSQGTCSGTTTVSCPLGTIRRGGSAQVAIVVTKNVGGQVTNTASVSAVEADPNSGNNSNGAVTTPVQLMDVEIE